MDEIQIGLDGRILPYIRRRTYELTEGERVLDTFDAYAEADAVRIANRLYPGRDIKFQPRFADE